MKDLTTKQLVDSFQVAVANMIVRDDQTSYEMKQKTLQDVRIELLRRLNKTDLEQLIEMLTRLGASFTNNAADAEDIEMYEVNWPTVHRIVTVYPIKDTWPLGYPYCFSGWLFDKDGKLIAQGASE